MGAVLLYHPLSTRCNLPAQLADWSETTWNENGEFGLKPAPTEKRDKCQPNGACLKLLGRRLQQEMFPEFYSQADRGPLNDS
jgi:hypothetical protein